MLVAYRTAFFAVEWLALAYSCALAAAALAFRRLRRADARPPARSRAWVVYAASIVLSTVLFALTGLMKVRGMTERTLPWYDQGAYIIGARAVHDAGGPLGALGRCFVGKFPQTRRDPLFLLVCAPFADEGASVFESGKLAALTCGVLAVASAGFVAWRLFNPVAGVVTAFGLSMNHFVLQHSALMNCEPLYMLLSVWAVYFIVAGAQRRRLWIVAGVLTGLAHMAKGSGILLVGAFAVAAVWTLRWRVFREKYVYLFFLAFLLTSSPFLIDATIKHGNPLYNVNSHLMWADTWDEATSMTPEQLAQANAWGYLRQHGVMHAWHRLRPGMFIVSSYFVNTAELRILLLKYARGDAVLLLALLAWLFDRNRFRQVFFLALIPMFLLLIGWLHAIGTSERHILPLVPFTFAYFGDFLSKLQTDESAHRRIAWAHVVAAAACILFMLVVKGHRIFAGA